MSILELVPIYFLMEGPKEVKCWKSREKYHFPYPISLREEKPLLNLLWTGKASSYVNGPIVELLGKV